MSCLSFSTHGEDKASEEGIRLIQASVQRAVALRPVRRLAKRGTLIFRLETHPPGGETSRQNSHWSDSRLKAQRWICWDFSLSLPHDDCALLAGAPPHKKPWGRCVGATHARVLCVAKTKTGGKHTYICSSPCSPLHRSAEAPSISFCIYALYAWPFNRRGLSTNPGIS